MVGVIAAGITYAILSDPELPTQGLFKATLKEFSKHARPLETQFKSSKKMQLTKKKLIVTYSDSDNPLSNDYTGGEFIIHMQVSEKLVTFVFDNKSELLAGESIILEPQIIGSKIVWKCINGSVLARVRTKNCRLGYGHFSSDMAAF